jgi:DNA-binding LacI/PurR family transcriptional regulator
MTQTPASGTGARTPGKRVTSADVARACGVSRATVSYVLNDVPGRMISAATRELVIRTARELGHVPFAPARSLRLGRSDTVLVLVRDFTLGFISNRLLRKIDVALAERGYVMLIHRYDESLRTLQELWQLVSPTLVVAMGGLSVSEQSMIEGTTAKLLRVHGMMPNAKVGAMQGEYLHERGHSAIGYALPAAPSLELIAQERLRGVEEACERLGMPAPQVRTVDLDDPETVVRALDEWLEAGDVTAVATHNDEMAIMLSAALAAKGMRAGEDLAIIGVDNIPSARIDVTTVEIDVEAWGDYVVESVLALLENREPEPMHPDFLRLIPRRTA